MNIKTNRGSTKYPSLTMLTYQPITMSKQLRHQPEEPMLADLYPTCT